MSTESEAKCLVMWAKLIFLFIAKATRIKIAEDPQSPRLPIAASGQE